LLAVPFVAMIAGPRDGLGPLFIGAFLLPARATRLGFQKYYDPYALLALIVSVRPGEFRRVHHAGVAILVAGSIAFAAAFAAGAVV